jgi:acyl-CoA synthetase (AMP-forming)/AMP-acid ligase II
MLYTGGTTGMPKGVMWRQDDHIRNIIALGTNPRYGEDPVDYGVTRDLVTRPGHRERARLPAHARHRVHDPAHRPVRRRVRGHPREPPPRHRGAVRHHRAANRVNTTAIVGDAFAKPMLRALDAEPERWDLTSLIVITSSGVMFSEPSKQA